MRFSERINSYLAEAPGEQFRVNKWRFWFVALIAFSILNAALTALVFSAGGVLQTYMGTVLVGVGALLAWLGVCALYYSDSSDTHLSRGVAILDSVTLLFVVAHFSFLLWCYGHLSTLQNAEADYKAAIATYNTQAEAVQAANDRIAQALAKVSENETKRARIENDTIYQARKAAQAGAKVQTGGRGSLAGNISTSPVELAKPPSPPADSSADYLTRWDSTIRLANFGELALAIFTLIFIRVRSSLTNAPIFQDGPRGAVTRSPAMAFFNDTVSSERDSTDAQRKTTRVVNREGLKRLRETLKEIAFRSGKTHFKTDPKPEIGAIWIRQYKSSHGVARERASVKAKIEVLDDALRMAPAAFRERLERFLRQNRFEL